MSWLLLLEKLHGHVGLLGIALCFHPVLSLRKAQRPTRRVRLSGYLALLGLVLGNALGWLIYPEYRQQIRGELYLLGLSDLFEVKEHLAWYSLALAALGAGLLRASAAEAGPRLRSLIRRVWGAAGALASVSAGLGIYLASVRGF